MPISHEHQLSLLKDILTNHQADNCGSTSECEQMERLVQSLLTNEHYNEEAKNILQEISKYSQAGSTTENLDGHISSHNQQLLQWVENMGSFS
ncbi:YtzH-like family protein [Peribacillus alkalitolerans]|uniref:YtzH-like family protein n=1 Tax=Peribacillus alkalitolerans TaxID=1550385 RepID=UPI0013D18425|nr:YtzH-like family protein [Peribacillus alkalitolerans]